MREIGIQESFTGPRLDVKLTVLDMQAMVRFRHQQLLRIQQDSETYLQALKELTPLVQSLYEMELKFKAPPAPEPAKDNVLVSPAEVTDDEPAIDGEPVTDCPEGVE